MSEEPKYWKSILCLANSRRLGGRCVAGKEFQRGEIGDWIRPVSGQNDNAISQTDLKYEDGTAAELLDIVKIPMIEAQPQGHQSENHLVNLDYYWEKLSRATWAQIVAATDKMSGPLWLNDDSSYHGTHDKVTQELAKGLTSSLLLIKPARLALVVANESEYQGGMRRRVRADFDFNGVRYNFVVTDPWIETKYFGGADGTFPIPESRLCISLSEIVGGNAIKLVAAVITPERAS